MTAILLILRPEPGASATARKVRALGLRPVVTPLFAMRGCEWSAPDPAPYDAVLMTSANAARHAGPALATFHPLPLYAVGAATAAAARKAGFAEVIQGDRDADAILARAAARGVRRLLHLSGREHRAMDDAGVQVDRRIVYAADPVERLSPDAADALARGAVALLHSPRAAWLLRTLIDQAGLPATGIAIVAISPAALAAAGPGWRASTAAATPDDDALLAAAARLCDHRPR